MRRLAARLRGDTRGATIIEFAIVLPVMLLMIMGMMDLCYQLYVQSILTGAVQKAGRDSAIETNISGTADIDAKVLATVRTVARQAVFVSPPTRSNFTSFQQVNRVGPEPFVDGNGNLRRDAGECFDDINGNGTWDVQATADLGANGTGGASDVVTYTVVISYPRLFPFAALIGWGANSQLSSSTMLRNQPFASQTRQEQTICA